jgi:hypothetical protein
VPNLLSWHSNLQQIRVASPFLASYLEASPVSLLEMASDDDCDKRPWSEGPSHGSQSPPPRRVREVAGPDWALVENR